MAEKKEETDESKKVETDDKKLSGEESNVDLIEPVSKRGYFRRLGVRV